MVNIDTDLIRNTRVLERLILDNCEQRGDCLVFPDSGIAVQLSCGRTTRMSPARVAWALAHPETHLGRHDYAVHTCDFAWTARECCVNVDHIRKGKITDAHRARVVGAITRHLELQIIRGGSL